MKSKLVLWFLIMFVIGTDTFLISPLLPTLRESFGISTAASGWLVGAYALGYALLALVAGPLSDGVDRKKVLVYGLAGFAVSTFLCGVATSFWMMFAFRFLAGVCAAFATPQVWASIPVLVPRAMILRAMGIATAGLSVSQLLGVPLGSYLAAGSWSTPFFVIGALALVLVVLVGFILPSIPPLQASSDGKITFWGRYRELMAPAKAKKSFLAYFLFQTGNFAVFSFIGTWLAQDFGLSVSRIGTVILFIGLGNVIGNLIGPNVVSKIGGWRALLLGMLIDMVINLVLPHAPWMALIMGLFAVRFVIAGVIFPVMVTGLQSLSATARGTIAALMSATMYVGTTLGAWLAGLLLAKAGSFAAVTGFAVACYVVALVLFWSSQLFRSAKDASVQQVQA